MVIRTGSQLPMMGGIHGATTVGGALGNREPFAIVSTSNADTVVTGGTYNGYPVTIYKFTTVGERSITFSRPGMVDVLCIGASGTDHGYGGCGGGGYVTANDVWVPSGAIPVIVPTQNGNYQSCGHGASFLGIRASGGGNGSGYNDRTASAGSSGGGTSGASIPAPGGSGWGCYGQGTISVSGTITRGGNGSNAGGGAGGDASGGTPGVGVTTTFGGSSETFGAGSSTANGRVYIRVRI
jgi:hypothetical protein